MTVDSLARPGGASRALTVGRSVRHASPAQAHLMAAFESSILPRLLRRSAPPVLPAMGAPLPVAQSVVDLAAFALAQDAEATRRYVQEIAAARTFESMCFGLLAPAARHLGDLWCEDLCTFTDVTIGMLHLQHALHAMVPRQARAGGGFRHRRILLAPAPGEQHTFGLSMVETFFARAGWHVVGLSGCTVAELSAQVRAEWFGVVGLSVGSEVRLAKLTDAIAALRRAARNGALAVIVGGPIFVEAPELALQVGADGTAADGQEATWLAESLMGARPASVVA